MKNKSAVLFALFLMGSLMGAVYAASGVRGAKAATSIATTTSVIGVSSGPAVLYSVLMSSGAVNDFVVFFDSNSAVGITNTSMASALGYRMRFYSVGFTSATTVYTLDPPVQFYNGMMVSPSAIGLSTMITYEKGRITQGY